MQKVCGSEPMRKSRLGAMQTLVGLTLAALSLATPARADFASCVAGLRGAAEAKGVSAQTFDRLTRDLEPNPDVIKAEGYQPEFKTAIWDYLAGLVDEERVDDGRAAMRENERALCAPPRVATACRSLGDDRRLGRRIELRAQLRLEAGDPVARHADLRGQRAAPATIAASSSNAMKIVQSGDIDPRDFNGSWAGAFGHTQFMPSTFLATRRRRRRRRPTRHRPRRGRRARLHRQLTCARPAGVRA